MIPPGKSPIPYVLAFLLSIPMNIIRIVASRLKGKR